MESLKTIAVAMIVAGLALMIVGLIVTRRSKDRRDRPPFE